MPRPNMLARPNLVPDGMGLGFIDLPDPRDDAFPMRALLDTPRGGPARPWRYWWDRGWWGYQGSRPWCVAYAWLHALEDGPLTKAPRTPGSDPVWTPRALYDRAQRLDEWWGENYDGTSVRAGAKALQERGLVGTYRWAYTLEDLRDAVTELGPVVVGTWWYTSMFYPTEEGFLEVNGSRAGGHAYVVNGVNSNRGVFRVKNSWGPSWGLGGRAWIGFDEMRRLLEEQGEACIAEQPLQGVGVG